MIKDEEIDALPEDNDLAFVQYETIVRESAAKKLNSSNWNAEREYVTHILAFIDTGPVSGNIPNDPPIDDNHFPDWYRNGLIPAVDRFKARVRLQRSARQKANVSILTLSKNFKTQIGGHLTAVRKIVVEADLSQNKRDAIFRRINNLQEEVDRDRTRTEAVVALWLDVSSAIGHGAKNLDPVIDRLERIMKVLAKAKDHNEAQALISPPERKQIAPPTNDTKDEIPF